MPSILRIGPRASHEGGAGRCLASRLRSAILSHFADGKGGGNAEENIMMISNKYFSAEVALEYLADQNREGGSLGNEDGVVLVFDARATGPTSGGAPSDPSVSFDALTSVHDMAVASEQDGDLLRLCVGVGLDAPLPPLTTKAAEEEYSRRVLWCLDRGYEYVEADLSEAGLRTGHDERDKEGFARVAEAVGGTVWSGATMKPRKAAQLRMTFDEAESGLGKSPAPAADVSSTLAAAAEENKEEEKDITRGRNENINRKGALGVSENIKESDMKKKAEEVLRVEPPENVDEEAPGDKSVFGDFDSVLQQAAAVRAASKSGDLSDEERRKRAGDVAMMLAGLMGDMDPDDSDDEGERSGDVTI